MRVRISTAWLKIGISWAAVFALRLLPFRAPNVEPILATVMPFSRRLGACGSFGYAFLAIVLYDLVTSGWGSWTWVTAAMYGLLGLMSYYYFARRPATRVQFVGFGVVATLLYDAVTGLAMGPIFDGQPFTLALAGQIPFTILHLLGTIAFAAVLSPALARWIAAEHTIEFSFSRETAQS